MLYKKLTLLFALLLVLMTNLACAESIIINKMSPKEKKMKTIPSIFEHVDLNIFDESKCTPELKSDFIGIEIAAPNKVIVYDEFILPICGSWQFTFKLSNQFNNDINNEMVIIIVDSKTHKPYSTDLLEPGSESSETQKFKGTDKELEANIEGGWFNVNAYDYIEELPEKPGKYIIYAIIGDIKSNVVEVEIEIAKGETPAPRAPRPN